MDLPLEGGPFPNGLLLCHGVLLVQKFTIYATTELDINSVVAYCLPFLEGEL